MNRVDFFKHLFLGFASLLLFKESWGNKQNKLFEIRLCSPFVAGFQYYDGFEAGHLLRTNDLLSLKREPTNPHDCCAIEVFQGEAKLGYLPRNENKVAARRMDQGVNVKARIVGVDRDAGYYNNIKINVFYEI